MEGKEIWFYKLENILSFCFFLLSAFEAKSEATE